MTLGLDRRDTALWLVVVMAAVTLAPTADAKRRRSGGQAKKAASALEQDAFDAINKEDFCAASRLFSAANAAYASPDYIYNAAYAADIAGDRKLALRLYAEVAGTHPDPDRQAKVNARIAELPQELAQKGAGNPCPEPSSTDAPSTSVAPAEPVVAPETKTPPDAADPQSAPDEQDPLPEDPAKADGTQQATGAEHSDADDTGASDGGGLSVWPWVVVGVGAAMLIGGIVVAVASFVPRIGHSTTNQAVKDAQASGDEQAAADLQGRLALMRFLWEGIGQFTLPVGALGAVFGILTVGGGATWGIVDLALTE